MPRNGAQRSTHFERFRKLVFCYLKVSELATGVAVSTSLLLAATPVQAAQEVAQLAAQDNRLGAVAFIFVPAIAWVLFNILGPASRQFDAMSAGKPKPAAPRSAGRAPAAKKAPARKAAPAKKAPARKAPAKKAPIKKKPVLAKKR